MSRLPLLQSAYKYISPKCLSSTLRLQPSTSPLFDGDPKLQLCDPNQQEPSLVATLSLQLCLHPFQDNGDQLRRPYGLFRLRPLLLQFLLPLQVHIVGDFLFVFLCPFDLPNLGTMQQVSYPNRSATHPVLGPDGQSRSN